MTDHPPTLYPGLEGVTLDTTRTSRVDGQQGRLLLGGFEVEDIAPRASFEEMVHLLWAAELPTHEELAALRRQLGERRELPEATLHLLAAAARRRLPVMDALILTTGTLALCEDPPAAPYDSLGLTVLARLPGLVAAYWRLLHGEEPVAPRPELGHAAGFLYQLRGEEPEPAAVRALDTYLNTVCDHGLNASTFTTRVIVSTRSDLLSALVGALGALKGPLHGGAPGPALEMVFEIGEEERAEPYLRARLEAGERLMGFGHRVYKVRDPRAEVLGQAAERLYETAGDPHLYRLARHVEATAVALLAEHKPGRRLETNVEFYTALLLHGLGLEPELFTPVFAIARTAGWVAHGREQRETGRLIRPRLEYAGRTGRQYLVEEAIEETAAVGVG